MANDLLQKSILKSPACSGIYIFSAKGAVPASGWGPAFDGKNKPLYIGKAFDLRKRIQSYVKTNDTRLQKMISLADKIDFVETESEIEALILESQYIKKYQPPFNIMLRDDKQFFYVGFTDDTFPKLFLTHRPATDVALTLSRRDRSQEGRGSTKDNLGTGTLGPFTDGTALKTTLRYLRRIFPYCTCKKPHNNFCLNYHIGKCPGFCCLKDSPERSRGIAENKSEYKKNIKAVKNILSGKKNVLLKNLKEEMIALGEKEKFKEAIVLKNKIEKLERTFANAKIIKEQQRYDIMIYHTKSKTMESLKKILGLPRLPRRIEGYDIANIQGQHAVGAMVVFVNGKPDKKEYRKFKIYTKQTADDTAMLKEVLTRRFRHREWPLPDLVVLDGGKGQLNIASSIMPKNIKVVALTKNEKHRGEKIYIAGRKKPIFLSQLPASVKNLFLQINSEAHRFVVSYYRKIHRQTLKKPL